MKKTFENIKKYWNERAKLYVLNPKSTTDDYWLRIIEIKNLKKVLSKIKNKKNILDIGCGDGFGTIQLAKRFSHSYFFGGDYSKEMIKVAKVRAKKERIKLGKNLNFKILDITNLRDLNKKFEVIITDRCLINLPSRNLQEKAILEIYKTLAPGGHYLMIENFIEGHNNMNKLRRKLNLKEIPVRWHNIYLNNNFIKNVVSKYFSILKRENISSIYYLITRVVYSRLCQLEKREPDYDHPIYEIAANLDLNLGDFGPINLFILKKI